jgi:hypothetical protein
MDSSTIATNSLWAAVGVGSVGVFGLPFGLVGLEGTAVAGERGDVVGSVGVLAAIYVIVSMSV